MLVLGGMTWQHKIILQMVKSNLPFLSSSYTLVFETYTILSIFTFSLSGDPARSLHVLGFRDVYHLL